MRAEPSKKTTIWVLVVLMISVSCVIESEKGAQEQFEPIVLAPASVTPEATIEQNLRKTHDPPEDTVLSVTPTETKSSLTISPDAITVVATPVATELSELTDQSLYKLLENRPVALIVEDLVGTYSIVLIDPLAGVQRVIQHPSIQSVGFLQWLDNGCKFTFGGHFYSLKGEVLDKNSPWFDMSGIYKEQTWYLGRHALSSNLEQWAFTLWYGELTYDAAEFQDLAIVNALEPGLPSYIAVNGGATAFAWSPSGAWITYTDFNENRQIAVFRAAADASGQTELFHFQPPPGHIIRSLRWSPDETHLAYSLAPETGYVGEPAGTVAVYNLLSEQITNFSFTAPTDIAPGGLSWNSEGTQLFLDDNNGSIIWVDVESGTLEELAEENTPFRNIAFAVPLDDELNKILISSGSKSDPFLIFKRMSGEYQFVEREFLNNVLIRDVFPAPLGFPGEAHCP